MRRKSFGNSDLISIINVEPTCSKRVTNMSRLGNPPQKIASDFGAVAKLATASESSLGVYSWAACATYRQPEVVRRGSGSNESLRSSSHLPDRAPTVSLSRGLATAYLSVRPKRGRHGGREFQVHAIEEDSHWRKKR